jgi:uncharacterized surface protein with fasciclin (FAS1) repeats
MITDSDLVALQDALEKTGTHWELTNYSFAAHGFTHPTEEGNDHFHFEKHAEARSWNSMHQHLKDAFAGKGRTASEKCLEYTPTTTSAAPVMDSGDCMDDNAAVEKEAGAWGVKECRTDLCEGQYAEMMKPLCKKTCGLCGAMSTCADDNAAVEKEAGAWGVKECRTDLCEGQYAEMMKPLCKKTCGLCEAMSTCADDNAAVEKEAGAWGVKECSADLCEGQYAEMMKPLCKKTCGLCDAMTSTGSTKDIVDTALAAGSFTVLAEALTKADLISTMKSEGPFTVFAPTDDAFAAALTALDLTKDELLNKPDLGDILKYHVVVGSALSLELTNGMVLPTVNGAKATITIDGATVKVDEATVTTADVMCSNGVIHIIDSVMLPPTPSQSPSTPTGDADAGAAASSAQTSECLISLTLGVLSAIVFA